MALQSRKLHSPDDLIEYSLKRLGHPVIKIEVDYEQCLDRVYDAIQKFIYGHFDGVSESWKPYVIKQEDVDQGYIQFDESVVSIFQIIDLSRGKLSAEEFERVNFLIANSEWVNQLTHPGGGLLNWHLSFQHLELMQDYFAPSVSYSYNETTRRMSLDTYVVVGDLIYLNVFEATDPDEHPEVYNNEWVKRYTTALIGAQWGSNISKYRGVQLPGGIELRGEDIEQKWEDKIVRLDEEFDLRYTIPASGFMM